MHQMTHWARTVACPSITVQTAPVILDAVHISHCMMGGVLCMGCLITLSVGMMHAMHAALLFVYAPTITDTASHCMFHSFLPLLSGIV